MRVLIDIIGVIAEYLENKDVQKLKPIISIRDFIHIDYLSLKRQSEWFAKKTFINLDELEDYIIEKQTKINHDIKTALSLINSELSWKFSVQIQITEEVKHYFYRIIPMQLESNKWIYRNL